MTHRLTILSFGRPRVAWPRDVARWATAGLLAVDHHPCLDADELESRLAHRGGADIVLLDGGLPMMGRELISRCSRHGTAVLVIDVDEGEWARLGATAVSAPPDGPDPLRRQLAQLAPSPRRRPADTVRDPDGPSGPPPGHLVAVTGHGGAGTSTIADGLAARWSTPGAGPPGGARTLLADLSLRADQHVHHDLVDPGPGVVDLIEAHGATAATAPDAARELTRAVGDGHRLLTGIRHPRDRSVLSARAVGEALATLRSAFPVVVADLDADVEGREATGSADVEDHNVLARTTVLLAGTVVVVARADLLGQHRLCQQIEALLAMGTSAARIRVVINGARRRTPRAIVFRHEVTELLGRPPGTAPFVAVPHMPGLEARRRDGRPPGRRLQRALADLDRALIAGEHVVDPRTPTPSDPVPVTGITR